MTKLLGSTVLLATPAIAEQPIDLPKASLASGQAVSPPDPMFQRGLADRTRWEKFINSEQSDVKAGSIWWAGQRSLPHPGSCDRMADAFGKPTIDPSGRIGDPRVLFYMGCIAAQMLLAPSDAMRKSEPYYRLGWNAYVPAASAGEIVRQNRRAGHL
jgi:hypothetical protein